MPLGSSVRTPTIKMLPYCLRLIEGDIQNCINGEGIFEQTPLEVRIANLQILVEKKRRMQMFLKGKKLRRRKWGS